MISSERDENGLWKFYLNKWSKNEKVVLVSHVYNTLPSFWDKIKSSFGKKEDNKPKVYRTLELAHNIESPSNQLTIQEIEQSY